MSHIMDGYEWCEVDRCWAWGGAATGEGLDLAWTRTPTGRRGPYSGLWTLQSVRWSSLNRG